MVWEYYGHNTLILVDASQGWSASYNWGIFRSTNPFVFLSGRLIYELAPLIVAKELQSYRESGRRVWRQELRLTPEQRRALFDYLYMNLVNEPTYRYDYFRDNCSTRVRDALDFVLNGAIRKHAEREVEATFRWHAMRMSQAAWPQWFGIQMGQGLSVDEPITLWDEMFLPGIFRREISRMTVSLPDGTTAPLVVAEEVLAPPSGTVELPEPAEPPMWVWWHLFAGILIGGAITEFARSGRKKLFAAIVGGWLLLSGTAGALMTYLWWGSEHADCAANMNLFYYSPLGLVLFGLFVIGVWSPRAQRAGLAVAYLVATVGMIGFVLEWIPALSQNNGSLVALALPIHCSVAIALRDAMARRENASAEPAA